MTKYSAVAKPYAKAAFDFAKSHNQISGWENMLHNSVLLLNNSKVRQLLNTRLVSSQLLYKLFMDVFAENLNSHMINFFKLLAQNKRLAVLPEILKNFIDLKDICNNTVNAKVVSAFTLTADQISSLTEVLEKRFKKNIKLTYEIDKNLLGGMIVYVDGLVFDGSGLRKLARLDEYIKGKFYATVNSIRD